MSIKNTNRPVVLAAIILAMFMAAVEATIVATAVPGIVGDLGGFSIFSWVFGSYLLMQVVTIPLYGKLSDIFGRKLIFCIGVIIFLVGSLVCGFATSMEILIIGRFIQGFGAGAVQPIATTIIGDIYTKEERANIQGYLASIWGISSILGPVLGGLFVTYTHWAWIFWMNIPIGIISMILVVLFLHEKVEKRKHSIDYVGSILLFTSITALMLVLIQGGTAWDWNSAEVILFSTLFLVTFTLFLFQERRAKEPVINLNIWKNPLIVYANLASFTGGALLLAISSYLPTYVQGVMGQPAIIAGFTLTMISIGWPVSSTIAGKLMLKIGFRLTALMGGIALIVGALIYITMPMISSPIWAGLGSFFIGVGMGLSTTTFIVAIQSNVDWNERGTATAANSFMRNMGGAVGVALLGGILNSRLMSYLQEHKDQLSIDANMDVINLLLRPEDYPAISESEMSILYDGLVYSLTSVYWGVLIFAVITLVFILFIPKEKAKE